MNKTDRRFENLYIWNEARRLVNCIYSMMNESHDWGFKEQIQRAAVSIMNNIAEGAESGSDIKYRYFLNVARGSCSEVRSMLYLCEDLNLCTKEHADNLRIMTRQISSGIVNLISSIKTNTK